MVKYLAPDGGEGSAPISHSGIKVSDLCGEFDRKPTCFLSVLSFDWLFDCGNISGPCMHTRSCSQICYILKECQRL